MGGGVRRHGWLAAVLVPALLLGGCAADPDEDGLTNGEEKDLGLDGKVADTDGDGLDDGEEVQFGSNPKKADTDGDLLDDAAEKEAGSDPTLEDTDGDGYLDYDEVFEEHDPADASDPIYKGGWPYNREADALGKKKATGSPYGVGDRFFRMDDGKDQFGDRFDLNDFGGRGRLIILDASATWCGPCQATAAWLSAGAADDAFGLEPDFASVREAVEAGDVYWVTFMTDGSYGPATVPEVKEWDREFPNHRVPVVTDPNSDVLYAINADGGSLLWPSFLVLDDQMRVVLRGGLGEALDYVKREM